MHLETESGRPALRSTATLRSSCLFVPQRWAGQVDVRGCTEAALEMFFMVVEYAESFKFMDKTRQDKLTAISVCSLCSTVKMSNFGVVICA